MNVTFSYKYGVGNNKREVERKKEGKQEDPNPTPGTLTLLTAKFEENLRTSIILIFLI